MHSEANIYEISDWRQVYAGKVQLNAIGAIFTQFQLVNSSF